MSVLSQPQFHDEEAAFKWLEDTLWPVGPVCPHCGGMGRISKIKANPEKRVRLGLHKCGDCKQQFTVKVGTVFEHARIPLHKMLQAVHLMCSSKKGISAHQLHCILEVQYKTAWFLAHRIREAMREGELAPMGSDGNGTSGIVEADETFIGREPGAPVKRAYHHKMKVLSLVDREAGQVRSMVVDDLKPMTSSLSLRRTSPRKRRCTPMRPACTSRPRHPSLTIRPPPTGRASTSAASSTPTLLRATSPSSSAA